jgi:hypothetical protein
MLTKLKIFGFEAHVGFGDVVRTQGQVEVQACKGCRSPNGLRCGSFVFGGGLAAMSLPGRGCQTPPGVLDASVSLQPFAAIRRVQESSTTGTRGTKIGRQSGRTCPPRAFQGAAAPAPSTTCINS